jgi:hypothetical protein
MSNLFENWGETKAVLLEGLEPSMQDTVGKLLENQKTELMISENAAAGATSSGDIAGFRKILLPMIRRIIPGTIANELVGVQVMNGPVDLVYSMRYRYAEGVTGGTDINGNSVDILAGDEAFGSSDTNPVYNFYAGGTANVSGTPSAEQGQEAGASGVGPSSPGDIVGNPTGEAWGYAENGASGVGVAPNSSALDGVGYPRGAGGNSTIEGSGGRKMSLEVVSQAVEAGARKLQASWTLEAMHDMDKQHGLSIENEMTSGLSAEIIQEIDSEIISDLLNLAGTAETFAGDLPGAPGYYTPAFVGDRFANLAVVINYVANEIGRKTRRGTGNFIVVSPMIVSVLQSASKSVFAPATEGSFKGPNNTALVGTLNGQIKVYSYLWNNVTSTNAGGSGNDTILVGYKGGNGQTDAGYFYCPYVPLMSTGVVMNPVTYNPGISLMTRYGKTTFTNSQTSLGNSADYYGKVTVSSLEFA